MAVEFLEIKVQLDGAEEATNQLNALKKSVKGVSKSAEETEETSDKATASLKKSASGMGKIVKSLGRVAFYRAIRTAIKGVTDALTEGLQNAYAYSRTVNGSLYKSLNRIASASEKMKNQLGAAFGTLIEALEPVITWAINIVTQIAEAFTKLIAALSGKSTYLKAKDVTKEWAEETQKGADAAEEWKNQLLGFDEINKLEDTSGSGTGTGSDGTDYGDLFEEVPLEGWALKVKEIADNIKAFFTDLWNFIEPWLENAISAVEEFFSTVWETVSEWVTSAWESLVSIAETLGTYLSGILTTVGEFASSVIEIIKNMFVTIASVVAEKLQSLKTKISEFFSSVCTMAQETFANIQSWATEFFNNLVSLLDQVIASCHGLLENAYSNIGAFVNGTYTSIANWAKACAEAASVWGQSIAEGVYNGLTNAWENINSFLSGTLDGFASWASGVIDLFYQAAQSVVQTISSMARSAWNTISSFASALGVSIGSWWSENSSTVLKVGAGVAIAGAAIGAVMLAAPTLGTSIAGLAASLSSVGALAYSGAFANGGTPTSGSLFLAGERGAELISSAGGSTSVSNQDQIANSVRDGNDGVVNAVYAMANAIVDSINRKDTDIVLDGMSLARTMYQYNEKVSNNHGESLIIG